MRLRIGTVRLAALAALLVSSSGCASLLGRYDIAPSGLAADDDRLRRMLVATQAQHAFERVQRAAPEDEMLYALYYGVLAYHAGSYAGSARALDIAAWIADDRMTKSLSRAALSVISNDLILAYQPSRTERLMIPYYAALARVRMGDLEGAAVEARRLSMLLQRYDDERARLDPALRATLRYIAGAVFEASGEYADADVAFRNAQALDSLHAPPAADGPEYGAVVVILEQGFVAHRVEQAVSVMLLPEEVEALAHGSADDRVAVSSFVAGRVLQQASFSQPYATAPWHGTLFVPAPERSVVPKTRTRTVCTTKSPAAAAADSSAPPGVTPVRAAPQKECVQREEEIDGLPYLLRIAWPVLQTGYRPEPARLVGTGGALPFSQPLARPADLSRGVTTDFESERGLILARTIARSTAKLALTKGAERRLEDSNETAGRIVGLLGNLGTALLERADTRSWHLLPAGVSAVRVPLPAGQHELKLEIGGAGGTRTLELGTITVAAGRVTLLPVRTW
jgi:hypothetical protein